MNHAIILDRESAYARMLRRQLQHRFPQLYWQESTSLKSLYSTLRTLSPPPKLLIYTPKQFPDWQPTWFCECIRLRPDQTLSEYCPDLHIDSSLGQLINENRPAATELYRLDLHAIMATVKKAAEKQAIVLSPNSRPGDTHCVLSFLSDQQLAKTLQGLLANEGANGLRVLLLPLIVQSSFGRLPGDPAPLPGSVSRGLISLLERLRHGSIALNEFEPYLYPDADGFCLSFFRPQASAELCQVDPVALYRLISLLKTFAKKSKTSDYTLIFCSGLPLPLCKIAASACDQLKILYGLSALRNAHLRCEIEEMKGSLPPSYKVQEDCLPETLGGLLNFGDQRYV